MKEEEEYEERQRAKKQRERERAYRDVSSCVRREGNIVEGHKGYLIFSLVCVRDLKCG